MIYTQNNHHTKIQEYEILFNFSSQKSTEVELKVARLPMQASVLITGLSGCCCKNINENKSYEDASGVHVMKKHIWLNINLFILIWPKKISQIFYK